MQKYAAVLAKPHAAYTAAVAAEAADATTVLTSAAPLETTAVVAARALPQFGTIYITLEFVGIHRTSLGPTHQREVTLMGGSE